MSLLFDARRAGATWSTVIAVHSSSGGTTRKRGLRPIGLLARLSCRRIFVTAVCSAAEARAAPLFAVPRLAVMIPVLVWLMESKSLLPS